MGHMHRSLASVTATPCCILLVGAPDTADLDWSEDSLLPSFDIHFARITSGQSKLNDSTQASSIATPNAAVSKWRSVQLGHEDNAVEGKPGESVPHTHFLSFGENGADEEREHSDFLEHSVSVFDGLASSQILPQHAANHARGDTTVDITTSFATTSATESSLDTNEDSYSPSKHTHQAGRLSTIGVVSNLKQIPSADYITSILPQTMTVNLVAGVITVSPARSVHLKKSNTEMDIVELIVGDETRAGFAISFWLVPLESQNKRADDLRESLGGLRGGDVVLVQNVALSRFRNCVYGQSLSKRFARNSTTITPMDENAAATVPANLRPKLQLVHDWAHDFVGLQKKAGSFASTDRDLRELPDALPPDTQD